ncbi:probable cytochrome P450 9f2 [Contarinia nasturtii]|uniref:probable cytochrome P450 9f2 n=1 Tax=Contarinia nasturtii TaxID=265458 RepID=UPI0012D3880F|nr:probable cytochrome P450 9f2 [Contarinia nasturtii]
MMAEILALAVIALFSYAFYKWMTFHHDYFKQRNLKYLNPKLLGNTIGLFLNKYTAAEFSQMIYESFPNDKVYGFFDFRNPQYVVRDPELIKHIGVKSFDHFEDRIGFADADIDKLWGNSVLFMKGEKWRHMRATLSPAFTGSKMRQMFELVAEYSDSVVEHFLNLSKNKQKINVEMKEFFSRYTNDVIATCAFGLRINTFADPENEFYRNGLKLVDFNSFTKLVRALIIKQIPAIARMLNISFADSATAETFKSIIMHTMDYRKQNNIYRPDMINMLMEVREGTLKLDTNEKDGSATTKESDIEKVNINQSWNDDEIVAQCFTFFIGGFDTTSTMLQFVAYELSINPDVQQRLYEEIAKTNEQLGGKRITYDAIQKMKYLDQVTCETLRKWPSLPQIDRICVKDFVYDDGNKLKFNIEKGTPVVFPIYGIQHDPKYYTDPETFDPERFSDENRTNIAPNTYNPFGIGPRNCIGSRFALMAIKSILYNLLLNFSFEPNEMSQIPLKLKKSAFNFVAENGVHIELKPRGK